MQLIDTHTHLHFPQYRGQVDEVLHRAQAAGVYKHIAVGTSSEDSRRAVELAATYEGVWASVGVHPHDAGEIEQAFQYIQDLAASRKVVAIGECGLDAFKAQTSREVQELALRKQLELAVDLNLPVIFHVRDAHEHFFKIIKDYQVRGILHSFTAGRRELDQALNYGLLIALNGIMTFTKEPSQLEAARAVPTESLVLETDCPFLSPKPHRGKVNEPARVVDIVEFLAELRGEELEALARQTTRNAERLFGI